MSEQVDPKEILDRLSTVVAVIELHPTREFRFHADETTAVRDLVVWAKSLLEAIPQVAQLQRDLGKDVRMGAVLQIRKEFDALLRDRDYYNMTVDSRVNVLMQHVSRILKVDPDACQRCGHSLEDHHPDCQPCPKCKLDYSLCRGAASGVCNQEFLRVESAAQASWEALNGAGSWQQTTQGQRDRYYRQISVAIDEADRLRGEQK